MVSHFAIASDAIPQPSKSFLQQCNKAIKSVTAGGIPAAGEPVPKRVSIEPIPKEVVRAPIDKLVDLVVSKLNETNLKHPISEIEIENLLRATPENERPSLIQHLTEFTSLGNTEIARKTLTEFYERFSDFKFYQPGNGSFGDSIGYLRKKLWLPDTAPTKEAIVVDPLLLQTFEARPDMLKALVTCKDCNPLFVLFPGATEGASLLGPPRKLQEFVGKGAISDSVRIEELRSRLQRILGKEGLPKASQFIVFHPKHETSASERELPELAAKIVNRSHEPDISEKQVRNGINHIANFQYGGRVLSDYDRARLDRLQRAFLLTLWSDTVMPSTLHWHKLSKEIHSDVLNKEGEAKVPFLMVTEKAKSTQMAAHVYALANGIPGNRLITPEDVQSRRVTLPSNAYVIVVDDIVATGETHWRLANAASALLPKSMPVHNVGLYASPKAGTFESSIYGWVQPEAATRLENTDIADYYLHEFKREMESEHHVEVMAKGRGTGKNETLVVFPHHMSDSVPRGISYWGRQWRNIQSNPIN